MRVGCEKAEGAFERAEFVDAFDFEDALHPGDDVEDVVPLIVECVERHVDHYGAQEMGCFRCDICDGDG